MDRDKITQRWREKVNFGTSPEDCWIWEGSKDKNGYGKICIEKKIYYATQIGWWLYEQGEINERHLFHTCDNPSCVNPNHLETRVTIWTKEELSAEEREERFKLAMVRIQNYRRFRSGH